MTPATNAVGNIIEIDNDLALLFLFNLCIVLLDNNFKQLRTF